MTLIAAVRDGDFIAIVSDTKVTYEENAIHTARLFTFALPKIVLLRDDLAVALSGDGPVEVVRRLMAHREDELSDLLNHLVKEEGRGFIVATLNPSSLWVVADGERKSIPSGDLALEGDKLAFADFEREVQSWRGESPGNALMMAMDHFAGPLGGYPSIGGYSLFADSRSGAFRLVSRQTTIAPRIDTPSALGVAGSGARLTIPAGSSQWYQSQILAGVDPTPAAVGIYIEQAEAGQLFSHDAPYEGFTIPAPTAGAFIAAALLHGQHLRPVPSGFGFPRM